MDGQSKIARKNKLSSAIEETPSSSSADRKFTDNEHQQEDSKKKSIREELTTMTFEELQLLKNELGSKIYNETVFGKKSKTGAKNEFRRLNKNRPREASSKSKASIFKEVFPVKKKVERDPRFDELSGEFNPDIFEKTYSFVDEIKLSEKDDLKKRLVREKNPEKAQELKMIINRMDNQEREKKKRSKLKDSHRKLKKEELAKVKDGKKPYFMKKGTKKKLELAEKFQELKKTGKLSKYLERKRKKNAKLDKRKLPT